MECREQGIRVKASILTAQSKEKPSNRTLSAYLLAQTQTALFKRP